MKSWRSVFAAAVILVVSGTTLPALAQGAGAGRGGDAPVGGPRQETYGTGSTTNYVLQAYAFEPWTGDSSNFLGNSFGSRACSSPCISEAPVMLPAGARIEAMELEACDTDMGAQVTATLFRQANLEGGFLDLGTVASGATPGCNFFTVTLAAPETVDNLLATYHVEVFNNGSTLATRFQAVRLVYRLQVSPAPATPTFPNDVPTSHPFFRFIEALAAAGITTGCGPGSYCPNNPITRGEMAVFLAAALGLHFPD